MYTYVHVIFFLSLLGQTFLIFRLSRIPSVIFKKWKKKKILNLDFFLLLTVWKLYRIFKKKSKTEYETIFYYAKNALREKNALNPNFNYTCISISVLLHQ